MYKNDTSNNSSSLVDNSRGFHSQQHLQRSAVSQPNIRSADTLSPDRNLGSLTDFNSTQRSKFRLRPEFPKIIDSIVPLMYNSPAVAPPRSSGAQHYRFQDKGMPVLINYRALQIKSQNQKIPVNILIEYFKQWIEIMKNQIDLIVWNLYEKAGNYSERCILEVEDLLKYNQKYMKYIMLSIIPSREIHQNHSLNLVDQTLSRQNLKLTACQHCYDYSLECEEYVEKLLTTEKMQSEISVEADLEAMKNKYKQLISDVECKQIFSKFTRIFSQNFLQAFAERAEKSKQVLNAFHDFRRQVGLFMHVDLLDTEAYDEEDALQVFSEQLPRVDSISVGLQEIIDYHLFSQKVRNLALVYRDDTQVIQEKLTHQICQSPGFMVQKLQDLFAAKFSLSMDSAAVDQKMQEIVGSNTHFIQTICHKMPSFSEIFDKFQIKQQEFSSIWLSLIGLHDREIGGFISTLQRSNASQSLYIDVDSREQFNDLTARGNRVEELYVHLWGFFDAWRQELELNRAEPYDLEVISRQLKYLNEVDVVAKALNQNLYGSHGYFNSDPASLLNEDSPQTSADLRKFTALLAVSSRDFKRLRAHNPLTLIFKEITMKDPLLKALLGPVIPKILIETIEVPSEAGLSRKIEFYQQINQEITESTKSRDISGETSSTLKQRTVKLFRNLIYSEMRLIFNYTQIPQFKDKLQKALAEIVNSDTHTELNEYAEKTIEPQQVLINALNQRLQGFDYPEFSQLLNETNHILSTMTIYNQIIGKQTVHIRQQTIRDTLDLTYRYFFEQQNPPILAAMEAVEVFLEELDDNLAQLKEFNKNNFTGYESLQRLVQKMISTLNELQGAYKSFYQLLSAWKLIPADSENLEKIIIALKGWLVLTHQRVFTIESKRQRGQMKYLNVCEDKDSGDAINEKVLRNKYFGLKSGLVKVEADKLKANITAYKQDKYDLSLEWEQKPKQTKLLLDLTLPFKQFSLQVTSLDDNNNEVSVLQKDVDNESEFKTVREEVEIDMYDIYQTVRVQVSAREATGFKRVQYSRQIAVSSFEKEVKLTLNEIGIAFAKGENFRIYVKGVDKILWKPQVIVCSVGAAKVQLVGEANIKQKKLEGAELVISEPGSTEIVISGEGNSLLYFLTIDCDGCEKDLTSYDHKVFVHGKSSSQELPQSVTYSMADSSAMRKEKPIWMLGYIKDGVFIKINTFLAKSEIEPFLQTPMKKE